MAFYTKRNCMLNIQYYGTAHVQKEACYVTAEIYALLGYLIIIPAMMHTHSFQTMDVPWKFTSDQFDIGIRDVVVFCLARAMWLPSVTLGHFHGDEIIGYKLYDDVDEIFWPQPIRSLKLGHVTGQWSMYPGWIAFTKSVKTWIILLYIWLQSQSETNNKWKIWIAGYDNFYLCSRR